MFLSAALCAAAAAGSFPAWKGTVRKSGVRFAGLAYFALVLLSALFGSMHDVLNSSGQPAVWFGAVRYEGMLTHLCYLLFFLCFTFLPADIKLVRTAAGLGLGAYCAVVLMQYLGMNPLDLFPKGRSILTNYEFQGTLGNIDMVSGYLCMVVPLTVIPWVFTGKGKAWLACGAAGILLQLCIQVQSGLAGLTLMAGFILYGILTRQEARRRGFQVLAMICLAVFVRTLLRLPWLDGSGALLKSPGAGWVSLAAAAVFSGLALAPFRGQCAGKTACLVLLGLCIMALILVFVLPLPEHTGLWEFGEVLHGRADDAFGSWRLGVWRVTLGMSGDSLLLGTGPDTFLYAFRESVRSDGLELPVTYDNPHSIPLGILSNQGLPALVIYLVLVGWSMKKCAVRGRESLLCALAVYFIQGLFTFSICIVSPMFWALLGMAGSTEDMNDC